MPQWSSPSPSVLRRCGRLSRPEHFNHETKGASAQAAEPFKRLRPSSPRDLRSSDKPQPTSTYRNVHAMRAFFNQNKMILPNVDAPKLVACKGIRQVLLASSCRNRAPAAVTDANRSRYSVAQRVTTKSGATLSTKSGKGLFIHTLATQPTCAGTTDGHVRSHAKGLRQEGCGKRSCRRARVQRK